MSCLTRLIPLTEITLLQSPSAPGLWLAFGRWRGAEGWPKPIALHSAGKGATRDRAVLSCLGEMAENLSIGSDAHEGRDLRVIPVLGAPFTPSRGDVLVPDPRAAGDPGSEGAAAGESLEHAIASAHAEKVERLARRAWWEDGLAARPIPDDWLIESGVRDFESQLRAEQAAQWRSAFFAIGTNSALCTILAITEGPQGRSMGTAAARDPQIAARKALEEAMLEEVPLITAFGKSADQFAGEEAGAVQRSAQLAAKREASRSRAAALPESSEIGPETLRIVACDLTLGSVGVPVVRCLASR